MKKKLFIGFIFLIFVVSSPGQTQLENPGFEDWEDVGLPVEEPVDWSSIKTSDNSILNQFAPIVWGKDETGHSGNYCVKLFNVSIFTIVAAGTLTNGRVHSDMNPDLGYVFTDTSDARWNSPLTGKPDSLVGWLKFFPQGNDVARVRALIHRDDAKIPENGTFSNWIAETEFVSVSEEIEEWTRFSVPFTYYNSDAPEYVLVVINSGDGTTPVEGSIAYFDDLELIYNSSDLRAGFEANPISGTASLTVQFSDLSIPQGSIISWQWDFQNDGTIDSYDQNPEWIYTTPGIYSVSLTISDGENEDTKTKVDYISVFVEHTIILPEGWSGISSFIVPFNKNIEDIFEPIINELIILQNESGIYWPDQNVNTLGTWETHAGYKIKVANEVELTYTGIPDSNKTISLSEGWNLIPVLSENNVDVVELFAGNNRVMVKEVAGWRIYWPEKSINTLGYLEPGKAYFVLIYNETQITFP